MSFPSVLHARGLPATRPATAPVCSYARRLDQLGVIKIPNFYGSDSHYRPCLQEYYADWAPEKLGTLDETLIKWEGKVRACVRVRAPAVRASAHRTSAAPSAGEEAVREAQPEVQEAGECGQVPGPSQGPVVGAIHTWASASVPLLPFTKSTVYTARTTGQLCLHSSADCRSLPRCSLAWLV